MSYMLSKLLPLFVYPLGLSILFWLLAFVLYLWNRSRTALVTASVGIVILWGASTPGVANAVLRSLEQAHPQVSINSLPEADAIVLLGGIGRDVTGNGVIDLSGAVDRVLHARRIQRAGKADTIIISAGGAAPGETAEAQLLARLLVELGANHNSLILEADSRNTRENATRTYVILQELGIDRVILVTSAFHMARAKATFERLGVTVIPAATDYQTLSETSEFFVLPQAVSLARTTLGVKEYIGTLVYRWRGWI